MQRIYRRRTLKLRFWIAFAFVAAASLFASRVMQVGTMPDADPVGFWLVRLASAGPLLIALVGLTYLAATSWGAVAAFDVDLDAGRFRLKFWRLIGWRRVDGNLSDISEWQYQASSRSLYWRGRAIRARLLDPPIELRFEVKFVRRLDPVWRRIAPGAVAAYERDRKSL